MFIARMVLIDMKRVLFISPYFALENEIAAIRATKLAKFLSLDGYEVTVFCKRQCSPTKDETLTKDAENVYRIIRLECPKMIRALYYIIFKRQYYQGIDEKKNITGDTYTKSNLSTVIAKPSQFKVLVASTLTYIFSQLDELSFISKTKKQIRAEAVHYEIVFSTFSPRSSHQISAYLKKRQYSDKWIADFRDNIKPSDSQYTAKDIRYLNSVKKYADSITIVSESIMPYLQNSGKLTVLTNGYDLEDVPHTKPIKSNDRLKFVYTGSLYGGRRDLSVLFRVLYELSKEGILSLDCIELAYAGRDFSNLSAQAQLYDCLSIIQNYGYISRAESIELQNNADILLLASWNTVGSTGILTGKFYEYLMMEKPIVCFITGNLPDSTLKEMIQDANVGCCWEEAEGDSGYQRLKKFIAVVYAEYMKKAEIQFYPNKEYFEKFHYKNITRQLEVLIETERSWR